MLTTLIGAPALRLLLGALLVIAGAFTDREVVPSFGSGGHFLLTPDAADQGGPSIYGSLPRSPQTLPVSGRNFLAALRP